MDETISLSILRRLGAGESIAAVCESAGLSRADFDDWWQQECRRRVPNNRGQQAVLVRHNVRIDHDRWGIPHIYAANDRDLMFAFGYAVARDRLFLIDYKRRKATGTLAEVLGREALESDVTYRTLGLAQIAEAEWKSLPGESRNLLQAYADGINAWIDQPTVPLPIEFDLLDYRPQRWRPQDSLAVAGEFRWYLKGRLPVIVVPELIKRRLGDGPLYRATLTNEADDESILQSGDYAASPTAATREPAGDGGIDSPGSNNWALSPQRSTSGNAMLAGDPHLVYSAQPIWFEVRLKGGSFDVAGCTLAGLPGVMMGRTPRVAWTLTNNICSDRDLYQEQSRPGTPECFLYDGNWEPAIQRREVIAVKGEGAVEKVVRHSRNGPIIDELLPTAACDTGPVSLRWLGQQPCGWLTALFAMNRANSVHEFCEATRPWICPSWNMLCADTEGHIALQTTGRIPKRNIWERGYRPGWNPQHQWTELTAFEEMPRVIDPPRGYLVTANNRLAPDDYPVPLACTSTSGYRARRIRNEIERHEKFSVEDNQKLQLDVLSLRAADCVPPLLTHLNASDNQRVQQAARLLQDWDFRVTASSIAASLFNVFFVHWCRVVSFERLAPPGPGEDDKESREVALLAVDRLNGLAAKLLVEDSIGWFQHQDRSHAIVAAFQSALDDLTSRLSSDMSSWQWGRLHKLGQPHYLSGRGKLGTLLDQSGTPMPGDGTTVCAGYPNSHWTAYLLAGNRLVADLGDPNAGLWMIDSAGASAQPGSLHYHDQLPPWSRGEYRYLPLDADRAAAAAVSTLQLIPANHCG